MASVYEGAGRVRWAVLVFPLACQLQSRYVSGRVADCVEMMSGIPPRVSLAASNQAFPSGDSSGNGTWVESRPGLKEEQMSHS